MGILRTNTVSGIETPTPVTGSVLFDGTGDNLSLTFTGGTGDGDFTLEYWVYHNTLSNWQTHFATSRGSTGFNVGTDASGDFVFFDGVGGLSRKIEVIGAITTNKWYHWAFVRSRGVITGYLDGVSLGTYSTNTNYTATTCTIGSLESNDEYVNGYISNLRFLRGTALYTANFTPPTRELQPIGDTVLLCCNNPDSAGAEGTGKTITVNGNAVASTFSPGLVRNFTFGTQFDGVSKFDTQGYFVPPSGTTEQRSRGRGLFGGGYVTPNSNIIDFIQIQTQGIAQDFGDLTYLARGIGGCSSSTRGIFAGGAGGTPTGSTLQNIINFVTIATTGNAQDFGDLTPPDGKRNPAGVSNNTRGLFAGGQVVGTPANVNSNIIDYITIASIGNAQDFGDLTSPRFATAGCSNATRGVFGGGDTPTKSNIIDYITVSSTGNAITFGNLSQSVTLAASAASSTRGIFAGGYVGPTPSDIRNVIEYITFSSTGNAQDFGDLAKASRSFSGTSNNTRAVFGGGYRPSIDNTIDFIIIASTGNAQDFGDLTSTRSQTGTCSDSHGGIS